MSKPRPLILTLSASDSSGIAGMPMDVRVQSAMGAHTLSIITANTAQNSEQFYSINSLNSDVLARQLAAVSAMPFRVIKIGMLPSLDQMSLLNDFFEGKHVDIVMDPVMGSSSGFDFMNDELLSFFKKNLLAKAAVITPNIHEAETLSGITILTEADVKAAAESLLNMGAKAVLIKGGHFLGGSNAKSSDFFSDGDKHFWLTSPRIETKNSRGTGCALSSALASAIALGYSVYDSVVIAKMAINQGLRESYAVIHEAEGSAEKALGDRGPVNILSFPKQQCDLPCLSSEYPDTDLSAFPECNSPLLGVYPVIDRASWIQVLAQSGITTMQLRIKDLSGDALENEINAAIAFSNKYNIRLFINDYWSLAIKYRAYGVHLGQEDLDSADIKAIQKNGLRLGISTHCHYEVARAHAFKPSYIACGPVYHTTTKDMPWIPHGLAGLQYWRDVLSYPLVAIGGINRERFLSVANTGVDSVAMITAITQAENPLQVADEFIQLFNSRALS